MSPYPISEASVQRF